MQGKSGSMVNINVCEGQDRCLRLQEREWLKKKESISNILLYLENRSAIICLELKRIYLGLGR